MSVCGPVIYQPVGCDDSFHYLFTRLFSPSSLGQMSQIMSATSSLHYYKHSMINLSVGSGQLPWKKASWIINRLSSFHWIEAYPSLIARESSHALASFAFQHMIHNSKKGKKKEKSPPTNVTYYPPASPRLHSPVRHPAPTQSHWQVHP